MKMSRSGEQERGANPTLEKFRTRKEEVTRYLNTEASLGRIVLPEQKEYFLSAIGTIERLLESTNENIRRQAQNIADGLEVIVELMKSQQNSVPARLNRFILETERLEESAG